MFWDLLNRLKKQPKNLTPSAEEVEVIHVSTTQEANSTEKVQAADVASQVSALSNSQVAKQKEKQVELHPSEAQTSGIEAPVSQESLIAGTPASATEVSVSQALPGAETPVSVAKAPAAEAEGPKVLRFKDDSLMEEKPEEAPKADHVEITARRIFEITQDYPWLPIDGLNLPLEEKIKSLYPPQSCMLKNYNPHRDCILTSKTGTGKTVTMYIVSSPHLNLGKHVIWTGPTKAVVNQLYKEAVQVFGSNLVGQYAGDDKKNLDGKYVIATTPEGFISALRRKVEWAENTGLLIVDEAHQIFDSSRGPAIDAAITICKQKGGRVFLLSGTFPNVERMAELLDADLFIAHWQRTKINVADFDGRIPDDLNVTEWEGTAAPKGYAVTVSGGYIYNTHSMRLRKLQEVLKKHEGESILIFVPNKALGYCLSDILAVPFHSADLKDMYRKTIEAEYGGGKLKTLIATTTLAMGVNTPCDTVVVFGGRIGSTNYLDQTAVWQMFGRAGRGRDEAQVYFLCDGQEYFRANQVAFTKTLPLPTEQMVLTYIANERVTKQRLVSVLGMTYAASFLLKHEVRDAVDKCVELLTKNKLITGGDGEYSLTKEGRLLARYFISPKAYIFYSGLVRNVLDAELPDVDNWRKNMRKILLGLMGDECKNLDSLPNVADKGCMLLSFILPVWAKKCPPYILNNIQMKFAHIKMDSSGLAPRASGLINHILHPKSISDFFMIQMQKPEVNRWFMVIAEMEKYKLDQEGDPDVRERLSYIIKSLPFLTKTKEILVAANRKRCIKKPKAPGKKAVPSGQMSFTDGDDPGASACPKAA